MQWDESLSVKVAQFDEEHKKLIQLIDNLSEAMSRGKGKDVLSETLRELINYTETHFKNEERLMQQYKYVNYLEHKKEHDEFVNKVKELHESYEKGNVMLSISVFNFLTSWVTNHIKKTDAEYGAFFNENGLK